MQVFCPKCGTSTEVAASATAASCSSCGAPLPVNLPAFGPPQSGPAPQAFGVEDMAAVPAVVPPRITFVWRDQQLPDGSWYVSLKGPGPGGAAFMAVGLIVGASYLWGTAKTFNPFPLLLGALALYFVYRALVRAINRITLRMDTGWVTVSRGPLPEGGTVLVSTPTILRFESVRTGKTTVNAVVTPLFGLQAVSADGSIQRLPIGDTLQRGEVDYAIERLKQMLTETQKRTGGPPQAQPIGGGSGLPFQGGGQPPAF